MNTEAKIKDLRRSELLRIEAAVVEVMEKAQFEVKGTLDFNPSRTNEGNYCMSFCKDKTDLQELMTIKENLGDDFDITVSGRDKTSVLVTVEAPEETFINMLGTGDDGTIM